MDAGGVPICTACVSLKDEIGKHLARWFVGVAVTGRSVEPNAIAQSVLTILCLLSEGPQVRLDRWALLSRGEAWIGEKSFERLGGLPGIDPDRTRELGHVRDRLLDLLEVIGAAGREPLSWAAGVALGLGGKLLDWSETARRKLGHPDAAQVPEKTEVAQGSSEPTTNHGFPSDLWSAIERESFFTPGPADDEPRVIALADLHPLLAASDLTKVRNYVGGGIALVRRALELLEWPEWAADARAWLEEVTDGRNSPRYMPPPDEFDRAAAGDDDYPHCLACGGGIPHRADCATLWPAKPTESPRTPGELCAYIAEHAERIAVRAQVNGRWGSFFLTELPAAEALAYALRFVAEGRIPIRLKTAAELAAEEKA